MLTSATVMVNPGLVSSVIPFNSTSGMLATAVTMKNVRKFRENTEVVRLSTRPTRKSLSVKRVETDVSVMIGPIDVAYPRWSRIAVPGFTARRISQE